MSETVFIIGPPRTGTSILTWELKEYSDTFLIPELNSVFLQQLDTEGRIEGKHFMDLYIDRVLGTNMRRMQAGLHRLAPSLPDEASPQAIRLFLARFRRVEDYKLYLTEHFSVVGEKIAMLWDIDTTFFVCNHQLKRQSGDIHIVTWRDPDAVLISAAKLLPELDGSTLIERLTYAYAASLVLLADAPRARFVPHGSVTPETIMQLRRDMKLDSPLRPLQLFSAEERHTYTHAFPASSKSDAIRLDLLRDIDQALTHAAVYGRGVMSISPKIARELAACLKRSVDFSM